MASRTFALASGTCALASFGCALVVGALSMAAAKRALTAATGVTALAPCAMMTRAESDPTAGGAQKSRKLPARRHASGASSFRDALASFYNLTVA